MTPIAARRRPPLLAFAATAAASVLLTLVVAALAGAAAPPPALPGIPGRLTGVSGLTAPKPTFGDSRDVVSVQTHLSATEVLPGAHLVLAVEMEFDEGWHAWANERSEAKGAAPLPSSYDRTSLTIAPVPGVTPHLGFAQWPPAHLIETDEGDGPVLFPVYEGTAIIFVPIVIEPNAAPGPRTLSITLALQACEKVCLKSAKIPLTAEFTVVSPAAAGADAPGTRSTPHPIFARNFDPKVFVAISAGEKAPQIVTFHLFGTSFSIDSNGAGFILLLLVAAVGGFLLNLTPCVLPVIPLKIMGLSSAAGTRGRTFFLGVMMSLGVVAFWMGLGVAVTSIKGFTSANQLFQYPWFVIVVGAFIGVMAVGLLGLFSVGLPQWIYSINPKQESAPGAFGFGVMTAILSTPCTAPLMGAAIAWATTQSPATVLAVFAAVGVGMALPYLVLAAFPKLTAKMPKSGPASDLIKQVMALLLLASAAFFVGAGLSGLMVNPPDPPSKSYWWVVGGISFFAGAWLLIRTVQITPSPTRRGIFGGIGVAVMAAGLLIGFTQTAKGPIAWTYYTPERLADAQGRGDVVVIDFTAEWCLNCKTLETTVLNLPSVAKELNSMGVAPIKVDLTGNNTVGNDLLKSFERITIPLLVVLDRNGEMVFVSDHYLPSDVLEAIERARGAGTKAASSAGDGDAGS